jgi:hypothetical protein
VIVRISGEDQYRLDDGAREKLEELEGRVASIVESGQEDGFREALSDLLGFVRSNGELVPDDDIVTSDYILLPSDADLEEARAEFTGEGLIPD